MARCLLFAADQRKASVLNLVRMPLDVFLLRAATGRHSNGRPGLAPEQIERQIECLPGEAAVNGLPGVRGGALCISNRASSMVQVEFRDAAQLQNACQLVSRTDCSSSGTQLPASARSRRTFPHTCSPLRTVLQYAFTLPDSATADEQFCACAHG